MWECNFFHFLSFHSVFSFFPPHAVHLAWFTVPHLWLHCLPGLVLIPSAPLLCVWPVPMSLSFALLCFVFVLFFVFLPFFFIYYLPFLFFPAVSPLPFIFPYLTTHFRGFHSDIATTLCWLLLGLLSKGHTRPSSARSNILRRGCTANIVQKHVRLNVDLVCIKQAKAVTMQSSSALACFISYLHGAVNHAKQFLPGIH